MTRIHYLQHVPFEGLGSMQPWFEAHDCAVTRTRVFAGEAPPAPDDLDALVVMGGPMGVMDEDKHPWLAAEKQFLRACLGARKPVLGVCLGAQLIAEALGARVYRGPEKEIGWFPVKREYGAEGTCVGRALPPEMEAFHWHGDTFDLPRGAALLARSEAVENQAFVWNRRVVGFQFHLETTPESAQALIDNCRDDMTEGRYVQAAEEIMRDPARFERVNAVMEKVLDCWVRMARG